MSELTDLTESELDSDGWIGSYPRVVATHYRALQGKISDQRQRIAQLEAEVDRLNKLMDPIDQECCELQAKWKAEAQWAAKDLVNLMLLRSPHRVLRDEADYQRAQRILNGTL